MIFRRQLRDDFLALVDAVFAVLDLASAFGGAYTPDRDKVGRANPWPAKVDAEIFFVVRASWNRDFLNELEQFPNGAHDDQIDAVSVLWDMVRKRDQLFLA